MSCESIYRILFLQLILANSFYAQKFEVGLNVPFEFELNSYKNFSFQGTDSRTPYTLEKKNSFSRSSYGLGLSFWRSLPENQSLLADLTAGFMSTDIRLKEVDTAYYRYTAITLAAKCMYRKNLGFYSLSGGYRPVFIMGQEIRPDSVSQASTADFENVFHKSRNQLNHNVYLEFAVNWFASPFIGFSIALSPDQNFARQREVFLHLGMRMTAGLKLEKYRLFETNL